MSTLATSLPRPPSGPPPAVGSGERRGGVRSAGFSSPVFVSLGGVGAGSVRSRGFVGVALGVARSRGGVTRGAAGAAMASGGSSAALGEAAGAGSGAGVGAGGVGAGGRTTPTCRGPLGAATIVTR